MPVNDGPWRLLADAVLVLHVGVVAFIVAGLALIVVGGLRGWRWTDAMWLRLAHLAAIGIVAAQSWLGIVCPLTTFEMWLRAKAGGPTYGGGFIEHWLSRLLYWEAPAWAFAAAYTAFGLLVVASWLWFPPRRRHRHGRAPVQRETRG